MIEPKGGNVLFIQDDRDLVAAFDESNVRLDQACAGAVEALARLGVERPDQLNGCLQVGDGTVDNFRKLAGVALLQQAQVVADDQRCGIEAGEPQAHRRFRFLLRRL